MSELEDLYQEVLLDHYRSPRHRGRPAGADHEAEGFNPLCGDRVKVFVELDGERLRAVGFDGSGCAISTASASLMTEALKGRSEADAMALFAGFRTLVTGGHAEQGDVPLGKLAVLAGVTEFPTRVKCATLAWHTLEAALTGRAQPVSTED